MLIIVCVSVVIAYIGVYFFFRMHNDIVHTSETVDKVTKHYVKGNEECIALAVVGLLAAAQDQTDVTDNANALAEAMMRRNRILNAVFLAARSTEAMFWKVFD